MTQPCKPLAIRPIWRRTLAAALLVCLAPHSPVSAQFDDATRAHEISNEVERIATEVALWPGFDPLSIPLAVYTGDATYLFRHPKTVEGFLSVEVAGTTHDRFDGRHPSVTSNSSAEIGGVMTATLLADGERAGLSPQRLAAVALHEAFHVFQRAHHPQWVGNEMDLLLYPFEDSTQLTLRRQETEALRRALAAVAEADTTCWTRRALEARTARFATLDQPFRTYERASEWNEGLAQYIQIRAAGDQTVDIPTAGFPPSALRQRFYTVGPAIAFLLDRYRPQWKGELETSDEQTLDHLLATSPALVPNPALAVGTDNTCAFTEAEVTAIELAALADADAHLQARTDQRKAFDTTPGTRIVIEALPGQPLWPQGFDPLNIDRVDGGLLHHRFLRLGNDAGQLTALDDDNGGADIASLTEGAGEHPLFQGIQRVEIVGLASAKAHTDGAQVTLTTPGLTLDFYPATLKREDDALHITLENPLP